VSRSMGKFKYFSSILTGDREIICGESIFTIWITKS